jgi:hypothetical protein
MLEPEPSKLAELRAKTDQQLIMLINHQVDSGLRWAYQLAEMESRNGRLGEYIAAQAQHAYDEAAWLMHAVRDSGLRVRLAELRQKLDEIDREHSLEACEAGR